MGTASGIIRALNSGIKHLAVKAIYLTISRTKTKVCR